MHRVSCSPPLQRRGFSQFGRKTLASKEASYSIFSTLPAYHSDSRTVNKERSESRSSSKVLRLSIASCGAKDGGADSPLCPSVSATVEPPFLPFTPRT